MYDWEHYDVPVNPKLKDRTVADLKLNTPKSLKPSNTVADAIKFLTEAGTNAVPVVDDAGRFEAVLTDESINMYLTEDSSTVSDPVLEAKVCLFILCMKKMVFNFVYFCVFCVCVCLCVCCVLFVGSRNA